MITGFFNSPSSVARSVLLQRNTPREMRGRVFSAFYVLRDIVFLIGMAGAGLADVVDIRLLIVVASSLLFVSAGLTLVAPGLGLASCARPAPGCASRKGLRSWPAHRPVPPTVPTSADGRRLPAVRAAWPTTSATRSSARAKVREVPAGRASSSMVTWRTRRTSSSTAQATAGVPEDGGYRGLATMGAGDFFGRSRH